MSANAYILTEGDLAVCTLCKKIFTDPRLLPCLHTFCLSCLRKASLGGMCPRCPTCLEDFSAKEGNLETFPRSALAKRRAEIQKVVDALRSAVTPTCSVCCSAGGDGQQVIKAKVFCVECDQYLCDACNRIHARLNTTCSHSLLGINKDAGTAEVGSAVKKGSRAKMELMCPHHVQQRSTLFCTLCTCPICTVCCATKHKDHKCEELNEEAVDKLRRGLDTGVQQLQEYSDIYRRQKHALAVERQAFLNNLAEVEKGITERADQARRPIDQQQDELQQKLDEIKGQNLNFVRSTEQLLESFVRRSQGCLEFVQDAMDNGEIADFACLYSPIATRIESLLGVLPLVKKFGQVTFKPTTKTTHDHSAATPIAAANVIGSTLGSPSSSGFCTEQPVVANALGELYVSPSNTDIFYHGEQCKREVKPQSKN